MFHVSINYRNGCYGNSLMLFCLTFYLMFHGNKDQSTAILTIREVTVFLVNIGVLHV